MYDTCSMLTMIFPFLWDSVLITIAIAAMIVCQLDIDSDFFFLDSFMICQLFYFYSYMYAHSVVLFCMKVQNKTSVEIQLGQLQFFIKIFVFFFPQPIFTLYCYVLPVVNSS